MSSRVRLLLGFAMAAMAAQGCTSTAGPSPSDGGGVSQVDSGGSGVDSGVSLNCDASLPVSSPMDPACASCKMMHCSAELTTCAEDCTCGPIETCLEGTKGNLFTACNGAIEASLGGNPGLTHLTMCLNTYCNMLCFDTTVDEDSGVSDAGDSAVSDAGDSGVKDAGGQ